MPCDTYVAREALAFLLYPHTPTAPLVVCVRWGGLLCLFSTGSCLAEPLWMRHKAKHGNEK